MEITPSWIAIAVMLYISPRKRKGNEFRREVLFQNILISKRGYTDIF